MSRPTRDPQIEALFAPLGVRAYAAAADPELIADLRAEESAAVADMVVSRQAEFATARACARSAMAEFGVDAAVPRREGGAPRWPSGMAGSISHTKGYCVAVAHQGTHTLGIDIEEIARIKPSIERRILVDAERDGLVGLDDTDRRTRVATIFAAKEAFYKAHYEVDARYLGFDAIAVEVRDSAVGLHPASGAVADDLLHHAAGRVLLEQGRVVVGVVIDAAGLARPLPCGE